MPQTMHEIGPHTPITNIPTSESRVSAPKMALSSVGFGDDAPVDSEALIELVQVSGTESALEFIAPVAQVGRDGWVKKIQVMPARKESQLPFGGLSVTEFWTVRGWGDDGLEIYDYGAIVLPAPFAQDLGSFGFGVLDDETLLASTVNIAGYPGDKEQGTLWYDHRDVGTVNPAAVYYATDTAGGQSGARVYVIHEDQRVGVAVHAYGGATANSGTRVSSQVFDNLLAWKQD